MERANEILIVLLLLLCKPQPAEMYGCRNLHVQGPPAVAAHGGETEAAQTRIAGSEHKKYDVAPDLDGRTAADNRVLND